MGQEGKKSGSHDDDDDDDDDDEVSEGKICSRIRKYSSGQ